MAMMNTTTSDAASDCSSELGEFSEAHMDAITTYNDFLHAYQSQYPESLIVLIGSRQDKGNSFGTNII